VLEPIWSSKPETASRLRGRIESILSRATALEYRTGENPARWRGNLEHLLSDRKKVRAVKHHPYVRAWDHHVLIDGARAILAELDTAGYMIVRKSETEQMFERLKRSVHEQFSEPNSQ
jgi:phosphohistidine phosphatase SixA